MVAVLLCSATANAYDFESDVIRYWNGTTYPLTPTKSALLSMLVDSAPDNVTCIEAAFVNCSALTSITIPAAVTKIEDYAFDGCTSLKEVHVKATVPPVIFSGTFGYISGNLNVYVPTKR